MTLNLRTEIEKINQGCGKEMVHYKPFETLKQLNNWLEKENE